jgi:endonuclease III
MNASKLLERRTRVKAMNRILRKLFPVHRIELEYSNPWELMVAVQLSAQCTDKRVNQVTSVLFKKYPTFSDYLSADLATFAQDIKPCGFYRNKAKNILGAARYIAEHHKGTIPDTISTLLPIPGVARKTANVLLANLYQKNEGIAVDTHIRRFAIRFDLSDFKDPVRIERDLMECVPQNEWWDFHHRLVLYGRYVCPARRHECEKHPLTAVYPLAAKHWPKSK